MAEGNPDTAILVAISFQAMSRLDRLAREATRVADTTVMLFFAAVYLEGTLDYIVSFSGKKRRMLKFLYPKKRRRYSRPGLQQKLAWFHNECIAVERCPDRASLTNRKIGARLRFLFPGFGRLKAFRNAVAHGHIEEVDLSMARKLRDGVKTVVDRLYDAAEQEWGRKIDRITTYDAATRTLDRYSRA
jgi:hypothetical protein